MPDEASTPPDSTSSPQAADTQAPPSEPVSAPVIEPTPPPEAVAPAPDPNTPTTPSVGTDTPPQAGGEETPASAEVSESVPESTPEPSPSAQGSGGTQQARPEPAQSNPATPSPATASAVAPTSIIGELLVKARAKIQARRRKKLERIMTKLSETGKISNNEVQKLLRVSDATATRYLDLLEKEGRLRQEGKTGKHVVYIKI